MSDQEAESIRSGGHGPEAGDADRSGRPSLPCQVPAPETEPPPEPALSPAPAPAPALGFRFGLGSGLGLGLGEEPSPEVERLLRPLFAGVRAGGGVAIAAIRGGERTVACRGYTDRDAERPVRADTRFSLGSVTKTFTALLLAEMVARGEVRYDDPIDRYLPADAAPGYPHERPITLLHLATHTSGLPRLPVGLVPALAPRWFTNPYATFTAAHLLRALPRTPVRGTPGTQVRYSNLGAGLLGMMLGNAAGQRYEDLLLGRVCGPLGLIDTSCGNVREDAAGYRRGRRIPSFRIAALPGAAALRSTADDMLRYLQAHLAADAVPIPERTGAAAALRTALREVCLPRVSLRRGGTAAAVAGARPEARTERQPEARSEAKRDAWSGVRICLTWNQREVAEGELVYHIGSTGGCIAFVGFNRTAQVGLVAMANTSALTRRKFAQTAYDALCRLAR